MVLSRGSRVPGQKPKRDGKYVCRNCDQIITAKRRTSYCSAECSDEFAVKYFPGIARERVGKRDQGVCAACGLDTLALALFIQEIEWTFGVRGPQYQERVERWGLPTNYGMIVSHLWEADHIVPYSEGGDTLGLDNLRTLCIWCHRERTRAWHGAKAAERRRARANQGEAVVRGERLSLAADEG